MSDIECPCKECICLPICRYKRYYQLFEDCKLVRDYDKKWCVVSVSDDPKHFIIYNILKPTLW